MGLCCFHSSALNSDERDTKSLHSSTISVFHTPEYEVLQVLGKSKLGKVLLVKKFNTAELFAMKVMKKVDIHKLNQYEHILNERRILGENEFPFLVKLKHAFQTNTKVYLVMEFIPGGDLFWHLQQVKKFKEAKARFYIAEIILALEYLHSKGIVYRDLKPENILLDSDGHLKLADFGLSKQIGVNLTSSMCGTLHYVAPEVLTEGGYSKQVDFWSLGAVLYDMTTGKPPFFSKSPNALIKDKLHKDPKIPGKLSKNLRDLLECLLVRDTNRRVADIETLKKHPFFEEVDWSLLEKKGVNPPFKPKLQNKNLTCYFDREFTKLPAVDEDSVQLVGESMNFPGFTFNPKDTLKIRTSF